MKDNNTELLMEQIDKMKSTINDLNKKLTESESLKSNFISNIMNEFYNPFSAILSMSEIIIDLKPQDLAKAPELAKTIHREASQLDFHLQNIFAAATIEAGLAEIEISEVNINSLIEPILAKASIDVGNKGLRVITNIKKDQPFLFRTDRMKLSLILSNLINNSIKYSPDGGEIKIMVSQDEDGLKVLISDEGPGIPKKNIKEVFNRFTKVDPTINSVKGGYGLGLSVVKSYLDLMNSTIGIDVEKGSKIELMIPVSSDSLMDDVDDDGLFTDEETF